MEKEKDEENWFVELETALLADCDHTVLQKICDYKMIPPKLRPDLWQACLKVKGEKAIINDFFDLEEQALMRNDCQRLVDTLGNKEEDKLSVLSDIESVFTTFSKNSGLKYYSENGWLEIVQPLLALKIPKDEIYVCFEAIHSQFIPKCFNTKSSNGQAFHFLRLLLLYHDPEFCSFLDTKKITPDMYASSWFRSLFSAHCNIKVVLALWDVYFQLADPLLLFFLSLVMLVNAKEQVMELKGEEPSKIIEVLTNVPSALEVDDISDLFYLVEQHYVSQTPKSIKELFHLLYKTNADVTTCLSEIKDISHALCLPVPVTDLFQSPTSQSNVRYFVVDCRPAEQYNNGHLSTAFHLDCSLMLQEPLAFNTAVEALLAAQNQAIEAASVAGGKHICFLGSGRDEEDRYVHMVVASFLKKHHHYVSLLYGGYFDLHRNAMSSNILDKAFLDHNKKRCLACKPLKHTHSIDGSSATSGSQNGSEDEHFNGGPSIFDKFTTVMKSKSIEMKGKLVDYITNPNHESTVERHVKSTDKVGKRYKPFNKFVIDDNDELVNGVDSGDSERNLEINVEAWSKSDDVIGCFPCKEVVDNGSVYASYMVLTKTHLFVLREIPHNKGFAKVIAKRPLDMIVQITTKRRNPDLITFRYGQTNDNEGPSIMAKDVLLIPKPYDITRLVKQQVIRVLDEYSNTHTEVPEAQCPNK